MSITKLCPFCDQEFNIEVLKGHIVKVHLGLGKLVDFMNIGQAEPEIESEPEESLQIKVEFAHSSDEDLSNSNVNEKNEIENEMQEVQITNDIQSSTKLMHGNTDHF